VVLAIRRHLRRPAGCACNPHGALRRRGARGAPPRAAVGPDLSEPGDFGLWIGEATGTLSALGYTAGLQRDSNVP